MDQPTAPLPHAQEPEHSHAHGLAHDHDHSHAHDHDHQPRSDAPGAGVIIADITDPSQLPQPSTPQEALDQARAWISVSADRRGEGWSALALLAAPPTAEVVQALRDGSMAATLKTATTWLGADSPMVAGPIMAMEVYARGAQRRTPEKDLRALTDDREDIAAALEAAGAPGPKTLVEPMRRIAALCHHEAKAWAAGDEETGKDLRAEQHEITARDLGETLPVVAKAFVEEGITNQTRTIGRLMLAYLSAETGKDFQRAVLGDTRGRSRL